MLDNVAYRVIEFHLTLFAGAAGYIHRGLKMPVYGVSDLE